jgi:hypothetical protein
MAAKVAGGGPLKRNEDATVAAFRRALRDRLAATAKSDGVELKRIRRQVAFDRLHALCSHECRSCLSGRGIHGRYPRLLMGLNFWDSPPDEIRDMETLLGRAIDSSNFKSGDRVKRPSSRWERLCLARSPRSPSSLAALS